MKRCIIAVVGALLLTLIGAAPARADGCPPASIGGAAVARIKVKGTTVPVKPITFRNGGNLDPPHTNKAAGISLRNKKLSAKRGATVITWHVRYGPGCWGTLNAVTTMPIGSTFQVGRIGVTPRTYRIVSREVVPKGVLKRKWFSNTGRYRLVLITCNDLQGNYFRKTMAIIAVPVPPKPVQPAPVVAPAADVSVTKAPQQAAPTSA